MYLGAACPLPQAELGIAIAKKMAKRAIDRNRLKRMIRELIQVQRKRGECGVDVVVRLRKPIGQTTRGRLRNKERSKLKKQIIGLI